jgi:hypothetical protein
LFTHFLLFIELSDSDCLFALGLAHADLAKLVGVGHLDRSVPFGLGDADLPELLLLGHVDVGLLNRLRGGFAADGLDEARFVCDIGYVDVDQHQADLA